MIVAYKMSDTGFFNLFHLQFIAGRPYYESDTTKREFVVSGNVTRNLGYSDLSARHREEDYCEWFK